MGDTDKENTIMLAIVSGLFFWMPLLFASLHYAEVGYWEFPWTFATIVALIPGSVGMSLAGYMWVRLNRKDQSE